jgi:hypothetical protein
MFPLVEFISQFPKTSTEKQIETMQSYSLS